jgi:hypothetical protein
MKVLKGSCQCRAIEYEIRGSVRPVVLCHCSQCRKSSGHYGAATQALLENVTITGSTLKWFRSSEKAERGFCGNCGSNLFWRRVQGIHISIWAGTIDGSSGLRTEGQLYPESAGYYYELPNVPIVRQTDLK